MRNEWFKWFTCEHVLTHSIPFHSIEYLHEIIFNWYNGCCFSLEENRNTFRNSNRTKFLTYNSQEFEYTFFFVLPSRAWISVHVFRIRLVSDFMNCENYFNIYRSHFALHWFCANANTLTYKYVTLHVNSETHWVRVTCKKKTRKLKIIIPTKKKNFRWSWNWLARNTTFE